MPNILKEHLDHRSQLLWLVWFDLSRQYRGALLSWAWALIQPLLQLFVYWFVMKIGIKAQISKDGVDLFPWLATGWVVWFYVSGVIKDGLSSLKTYRYIVTKMKFPVSVIPTVVALSNLIVHAILLTLVMIFLSFDGSISIHWVQLPFYIILMLAFAVFWSMFSAPLAAISKDFTHLVKSVMRILFWMSGVIYNIQTVDIAWFQTLMKFNPVSFFIEGYRNTLIYHRWFWEDWQSLAAFGITFAIVIFLAIRTFKRTRKEVVDVL